MHSFFNESQKLILGGKRQQGELIYPFRLLFLRTHPFLFLMTEGVSSNVSSAARKGFLISAEGLIEGRVLSHLEMEIGGGRDGDVFTLKERKN